MCLVEMCFSQEEDGYFMYIYLFSQFSDMAVQIASVRSIPFAFQGSKH